MDKPLKSKKRTLEAQDLHLVSKPKKLKKSSSDISLPGRADAISSPITADQSKKVKQWKFLRKPQKSYLSHLGSIVAYRYVSKAVTCSPDPTDQLATSDDVLMNESCLTSEDVKMMRYLIQKEYPDKTLEEIQEKLEPYSQVNLVPLMKEDIKAKYKDEMPRPPATAYMLFCKSKGPKLKEKHPELTVTDMAKKLGKKWHSLSSERQQKYKQQYTVMKQTYESKMTQFYADHPDARLIKERANSRKLNGKAQVVPSAEDAKYRKLMAEMPKFPTTSYFLFCKEKREKLQKKHPEISSQEVTRRLSEKWKSLEQAEKAKYRKLYDESAKEYKRLMKDFHKRNPEAKQFIARYKHRKSETRKTKLTPDEVPYHSADERKVEGDEEIDVGTHADSINFDGVTQLVQIESTEDEQSSENSEGSNTDSETETE